MKKDIFSTKEIAIIAMVFGVLLFAFYWYELRPYFATQSCVKKAERFSMTSGQSFERVYVDCLLRKGYK